MCHKHDYSSMISMTGSSNFAHGICSKPDIDFQDQDVHCS
jgi:hypothetical protein